MANRVSGPNIANITKSVAPIVGKLRAPALGVTKIKQPEPGLFKANFRSKIEDDHPDAIRNDAEPGVRLICCSSFARVFCMPWLRAN